MRAPVARPSGPVGATPLELYDAASLQNLAGNAAFTLAVAQRRLDRTVTPGTGREAVQRAPVAPEGRAPGDAPRETFPPGSPEEAEALRRHEAAHLRRHSSAGTSVA
jgi:hypothetical protein